MYRYEMEKLVTEECHQTTKMECNGDCSGEELHQSLI